MYVMIIAVGTVLIALSVIDIRKKEIPDSLNLALVLCALAGIFIQTDITVQSRIFGIFAISVPLLLITLIIPGAFGGGDIKLMAAAGFLLGLPNVVTAAVIGIVLGGVCGGVLLLTGKKGGWGEHFAFGPCLATGIFLALIRGDYIIDWYFRFF